ncbi:MBL fold metallo-hydrolase [Aureibaculum conchae]|uniref:MBL fold metallo-hydrolase n=1 Tax=Aureibaculum sp. 2308TA14-22 TaxID=3108392 RepID=UPI0033931FE2
MKKNILLITYLLLNYSIAFGQNTPADTIKSNKGDIIIQPIIHGTLVLQWNNTTIYVDPYGGAALFKGIAAPDLILITDIHGDHTNLETLKGLDTKKAKFIVPSAVAEMLKDDYGNQLEIIRNGEMSVQGDIFINALPMYNLPEDETSRHPKGRGNGYFLNLGGKAIYISGDTEDIKEMRTLKDIDIAFVCMNLPYTMDINQAADAVLEFKPKIVYPYHYRGKPNMSDTKAFKKLVNDKNTEIEVRLKDWYSN